VKTIKNPGNSEQSLYKSDFPSWSLGEQSGHQWWPGSSVATASLGGCVLLSSCWVWSHEIRYFASRGKGTSLALEEELCPQPLSSPPRISVASGSVLAGHGNLWLAWSQIKARMKAENSQKVNSSRFEG
jgi:hypothetical protein